MLTVFIKYIVTLIIVTRCHGKLWSLTTEVLLLRFWSSRIDKLLVLM